MIDGNGLVIFHRDRSRLGTDLSTVMPVAQATEGETGAVIADGPEGETVISGFARVPDTDRAVITQERWSDVIGPIRGYSKLLLGLLVAGGVLSSALVLFAIGRILRPVKSLTEGAHAHRRRQLRPTHRHEDRRRNPGAGPAVQHHGALVKRLLRRARGKSRGAD